MRAGARRGRWFDLVAMLAIGVVVVGAALIPAVTANSGGTITVRGDVTADGKPLAFFPVGFWSSTNGVQGATTRTDANGGFTIDVPATLDGFAFAGTAPDAPRAITTLDGQQYVRGIIGRKVPNPVATPLYQGWSSATGRNLSGGAAQIHFRLQRAGRIAGTAPIAADRIRAVQVRRLDGSVVQTLRLDARRRYRSAPLVPGGYAVALVPKAPELPVVTAVTVPRNGTVTAVLAAPTVGATVSGTVRTEDGDAGAGVPVLLLDAGAAVGTTTTTAGGAYRIAGVAGGDYTVEAGRYEALAARTPSAVQVPIPGATSTPTPTPSAAATPATTDPALQPVERTSDAVLPGGTAVAVPATLGDVVAPVSVVAAGRISGTVTRPEPAASGVASARIRIVVEEPTTHRIIRTTTAAADGGYSIGGVEQGEQYEVWAVTEPEDPTLALMGRTSALATASTTQVDITLDQQAVTLRGTVTGVSGGTVTAGGDALLQRSAPIDESGAYAIQGLVPGAYPVVVASPGRVDAPAVAVSVNPEQAPVDLQPGERPATFTGWFIAGGAGVGLVSGTASSPIGDTIRFGPVTRGGHVTIRGLAPGTYEYDDAFQGTVPTLDGPWFYLAPTGSFGLSGDTATDVGPIVLHVRAR